MVGSETASVLGVGNPNTPRLVHQKKIPKTDDYCPRIGNDSRLLNLRTREHGFKSEGHFCEVTYLLRFFFFFFLSSFPSDSFFPLRNVLRSPGRMGRVVYLVLSSSRFYDG